MASQVRIKVYVTVFINRRVDIYRVNMRGQFFLVNIAYSTINRIHYRFIVYCKHRLIAFLFKKNVQILRAWSLKSLLWRTFLSCHSVIPMAESAGLDLGNLRVGSKSQNRTCYAPICCILYRIWIVGKKKHLKYADLAFRTWAVHGADKYTRNRCCGSALTSMRIRIQTSTSNADPDPYSRSQTNANPCGSGSW